MSSTLRERRRQMLRDEILAATHRLMASRGYAAMSMDDLAAEVGISKPTLYNQFPTKDDIVAAMAAQMMENLFELVQQARMAGSSPLECLCRLLHAAVRLQLERRTTAMQLWMPEIVTILEQNPQTRELILRTDQMVVAMLREAQAAGEIDPSADLPSLVRLLSALIVSPNVGRLSSTGQPDPETMADLAVRLFRSGLARG